MIAKISKGSSFRGCLDYVLKKNQSEKIGGNMIGDSPRELATEYGHIRKLKTQVEKPVYHISLALPTGESFTPEQWEKVSNKYLSRMGLDPLEHQYIIARHKDTKHDHIHLIVNRISVSGKVFDAFRDQVKSKDICRQLEQEHGLKVVSNDKARNAPRTTQKERQQIKRTGQPTEKIFVQEIIKASLGDGKLTVKDFVQRLEEQGITAIPNIASTTSKMNGFSFQGKEMTYTGSQVGYSWKYLQPHLEELTESDIRYLQIRKERLNQGSAFDLARTLKNSIWNGAIKGTGIKDYLESEGWIISGERIGKNGKNYDLKSFCDIEQIEREMKSIQSLHGRAKTKAQKQVKDLVGAYHGKGEMHLGKLVPPETVLGLLVFAPQILFAGMALQFLYNTARQSFLPQNEEELRTRIQAIYKQSNDELKEHIKELQNNEVKQNARPARSNQEDSPKPAPVRSEARRENEHRREEIPENQVGNRPEHRVFQRDVGRSLSNDDGPARDDRSDETSHQPEQVEKSSNSLSTGDSNEFDGWNDLALSLAEVVDMNNDKKTEAVKAKERAWDRQNSILNDENGFSRYRLTLVPRGENETRSAWIPGQRGDTEQFFTADEVKEKITMLSRKNFEGYDVYVTPVNQRYVYIMIDDLKKESIEQMKKDGYQPNGVWETSKDNYQALFRLERSTPEHYNDPIRTAEQEAGAEIVRELTAKYQGDTKNLGIHKAFRLAGFSNKKPERNNEFTRIIETRQDECQKTRELLKQKAEALIQEKLQTQTEERKAVIRGERGFVMDKNTKASKACIDAYLRHMRREEGLANYKGWNHDQSTLDFRVCKAMMKDGWATDSVADCLLNLSPEITERHKNVEDYITRTIQKAEKALLQETSKAPIGETGPQFGDTR